MGKKIVESDLRNLTPVKNGESFNVAGEITEWPEVAPECDDPICMDNGCMVHGGANTEEHTITLDGDVFKPGDQVDIHPSGEYFRARFRIRESAPEPEDFEPLDLGEVVPEWASRAMMISHVAQAFGLTPSEVYDRFGGMEPRHWNCRSQIIDNLGIEVQTLPRAVDPDTGGYLIPDEYADPLLEMVRRGESPGVYFDLYGPLTSMCTPSRSGMLTRHMDPEAMRRNAEKYDQMIGQLDEAMANFTEGVARMAKRMVPVMERLVEVWSDLTEGMDDDDQESS